MKKLISITLFVVIGLGVLSSHSLAQATTDVTALQAQINALLQQVQQLQAQLAVAQQAGGEWCYTFNTNLKIGDQNDDVTNLARVLVKEGLLDKDQAFQDGRTILNFDEITASAVSGFQEKYKSEILTPVGLAHGTGYVGSATRSKLNKLYGCGDGLNSNQPPVISGITGPTTLAIGQSGAWTVSASDTDGDVLTYSAYLGEISNTGQSSPSFRFGPFSYIPPKPVTLTFTVNDGKGGSASKTVTVTVTNGMNTFSCGDVNHDGVVNKADAAAITDYVFNPENSTSTFDPSLADADGSGSVNITDAVYLIGYASGNGHAPKCPPASQSSVTLLSPNGGEIFQQGQQVTIRWNSNGDPVKYVGLNLLQNNGGVLGIGNVPNTGSYIWSVPATFSGSNFKIIIYGNSSDTSDASFSIVASNQQPSITLLSPNGGERWGVQSNSSSTRLTSHYTNLITWTPDPHSQNIEAYLEKYQSGKFVTVGKIISAGKGSIYWDGDINELGNYPLPGDGYYIRIVNKITGATDRSDASFTLLPSDYVKVDMKANGSYGPVRISENGENVKLSWSSTNTNTCMLFGFSMSSLYNLPTSGEVQQFIKLGSAENMNISLDCNSEKIGGGATTYINFKRLFDCGDVNQDGIVSLADATAISNYVNNGIALMNPKNADVNSDNSINSSDAVYLEQYLSNSGPAPRCNYGSKG